MAVSAKERAAPTAMVRFGFVEEPKHAGLVFTAFHKIKVSRSQQNRGRLGYRLQDSSRPVVLPYAVDGGRVGLSPYEPGMALRVLDKIVEHRRIRGVPLLNCDNGPDARRRRTM
jgi:hypothetical protein